MEDVSTLTDSRDICMGVSGTPKSSILIGFSIINHPFWGTPFSWKHPYRSARFFPEEILPHLKLGRNLTTLTSSTQSRPPFVDTNIPTHIN